MFRTKALMPKSYFVYYEAFKTTGRDKRSVKAQSDIFEITPE